MCFRSGDCDVMYNDLDVGVVVYHRERKGSGFPGHLTHSQNRPASLVFFLPRDHCESRRVERSLCQSQCILKYSGEESQQRKKKKKERAKKKKTAMKKKVLVRFCPVFIFFSFAKLSLCSAQFSLVQFSSVQFSLWANKLREEEEREKK